PELFEYIVDLRQKVKSSASVQLISSNPDFVIIDPKKIKIPKELNRSITKLDKKIIHQIDTAYEFFTSKCGFEDIVGYISCKTSLRPDRRLQIPHEGSLMKAIYTHLQTRQWVIKPKGLKYYAITAEVKDADRKALKTVATHSITTVFDKPQAAVDELFKVDSFKDCESVFDTILVL
ncbi:MAG: Cfr10I/Bse634I family restriction endonuclease, partial [Candidatus Omnitrophica bacterium]|nr:Cfr10I/Bse634I family restriction endonuclease [Candidatus Omnitrophota bacterium]